ncbi:MAG: hypothetical protein KBF13_04000 [Prevotella sp.]|jgi:hypothetical protein|nr:hypothetical protein [Prevotella sp.]
MRRYLLFFTIIFAIFSCTNNDEKELLTKLQSQEVSKSQNIKQVNNIQLSQYKDIELTVNKEYTDSLKELIENSFNNQLSKFEDNELGVIAGYKYMLKYIFTSEDNWTDMQVSLADRYFNTINIEQKVQELNLMYLNKIKELRTNFCKSKSDTILPKIQVQNLPKSEISTDALKSHSGNNLVIEIGTNILDWLLGIFLVWLLGNILGYATTGPIGCIITIISFIIMLVVSVWLTSSNDGKLLESLRSQQSKQTIDYESIKQQLDNNTIEFYEKIR